MQAIVSVQHLTARLKQTVENDPDFQNLWVDGEISNLTIARSGHAYFTLKDAESQMRCVMWRYAVQRQRFPLRENDQVLVHGDVTMYAPRGELQLQIDLVQPRGTGLLQLQMEELRLRLESEGLFDESRKRALPALPRVIGVVTAETGAVWHDIQRVVGRRYPLAELVLSPSLVQGDSAPIALIHALQRLIQEASPDVIIIGRGGGSIEDLWAFNDERVVRAIYASPVPIISAVGHENDVTLADYVADVRAGTPSMAAELATPDLGQVDAALQQMRTTMGGIMQQSLDQRLQRLDDLGRQLARLSPQHILQQSTQELHALSQRLQLATRHRLLSGAREVAALEQLLASLNPQAVLARGFAYLEHAQTHRPIVSAADVVPGDSFRATVHDGSIEATVSTAHGQD